MSQRSKAELLLLVTTFVWGSTFVIVKGALADASPFPFLAFRFTLAGLLMWMAMARGPLDRRAVIPSLVLGLFLFSGFAFQTWGLVFTTPSKSAFITDRVSSWCPLSWLARPADARSKRGRSGSGPGWALFSRSALGIYHRESG